LIWFIFFTSALVMSFSKYSTTAVRYEVGPQMVPIQPTPVDNVIKALQIEKVGADVCCVHVPL
jgi:hypothetical protein